MSEFTPTTTQVRDGYRYDPEAEYRDPITPHHEINGRAFDRWLAERDRRVRSEAWDEGFNAGYDQVLVEKASAIPVIDYRKNPYRLDNA
jgi:hypothetical protein